MFSLQYNLPLPTKLCTKEDFYKIVGSDRVKNKITEFRKLKAEGNDKEADAISGHCLSSSIRQPSVRPNRRTARRQLGANRKQHVLMDW